MTEGLEIALTEQRDRLTGLLGEVKAGKRWCGDVPGPEAIPSFIALIRSAIDQIELALANSSQGLADDSSKRVSS